MYVKRLFYYQDVKMQYQCLLIRRTSSSIIIFIVLQEIQVLLLKRWPTGPVMYKKMFLQ